MRAESVTRITNKKYRVVLGDGTALPLYAGEVRRFHIEAGEEIPDETLRVIREEILKKRAKLRVMNLLKSMDRTRGQLAATLKKDGYPEDIAAAALDYAASYGYIDDYRYIENFIRSRAGKKSRRQIEYELMQKGIGKEEIRAGFEAYMSEREDLGEEDPETEAVRALVKKRCPDVSALDYEGRQKLMAYLVRRGFSLSVVKEVLSGSET